MVPVPRGAARGGSAAAASGTGVAAGAIPADFPRAQFEALYQVAVTNHRFASQYEVETVQANVHHFTARDNITGIASGTTWQHAPLRMQCHTVSGGHETLMQGEQATALARQLAGIFAGDSTDLTDNKNKQ